MDTFISQRLAHHCTDLVGESQLDGSGPPGRLEAWIYLPASSPLALSEILGTFVKVFERKIRPSLHSHGPGHQGYASILASLIVKLLEILFEKIPPRVLFDLDCISQVSQNLSCVPSVSWHQPKHPQLDLYSCFNISSKMCISWPISFFSPSPEPTWNKSLISGFFFSIVNT